MATGTEGPHGRVEAGSDRPRRPLPAGYRQGIITAISILLGFSLAFLRFWAFDAPGDWSWSSVASTATLVGSILLQIYTLLRSLRVADDDETEYAQTVRWFIAAGIILLIGLLLAAIEAGTLPASP